MTKSSLLCTITLFVCEKNTSTCSEIMQFAYICFWKTACHESLMGCNVMSIMSKELQIHYLHDGAKLWTLRECGKNCQKSHLFCHLYVRALSKDIWHCFIFLWPAHKRIDTSTHSLLKNSLLLTCNMICLFCIVRLIQLLKKHSPSQQLVLRECAPSPGNNQ